MTNVFLAPRSNENSYENFKSTITYGVEKERIWSHLTDSEKEALGNQEKFYVWGNLESLRSRWDKMQPGDLILFYVKGRFVYAGKCQLKKFDKELSLKLWPPATENKGRPWSCLFFVKDLTPVDIPIAEINELSGYSENFIVQGFMSLNDQGLAGIQSKYGSVDAFIENLRAGLSDQDLHQLTSIGTREGVSSKELEKIDSILGNAEDPERIIDDLAARNTDRSPDEVMTMTKRIKRDYSLVKKLKKLYDNKCQICGFTFKTKAGKAYSEVAHIKPIASRSEGVDAINNMLVLCPNHHKMIDLATIVLTEKDTLHINGELIKIKARKHKFNFPSD